MLLAAQQAHSDWVAEPSCKHRADDVDDELEEQHFLKLGRVRAEDVEVAFRGLHRRRGSTRRGAARRGRGRTGADTRHAFEAPASAASCIARGLAGLPGEWRRLAAGVVHEHAVVSVDEQPRFDVGSTRSALTSGSASRKSWLWMGGVCDRRSRA